MIWPDGKGFAFTVIDDTDGQQLADTRVVYDFLRDLNFRTTKTVWTIRGSFEAQKDPGATCEETDYLEYVQQLRRDGFEIAWHMSTFNTSARDRTIHGLDRFRELFGAYPVTMSNHVGCQENMYWGDARLTGVHRVVYNLATGYRNQQRYFGHVEGNPHFWGDVCRDRIRYCRNFTFPDINTLSACPEMPYHDPERPYVNYWYAASEGSTPHQFCETVNEDAQDRLEAEGGACLIYSHFGFCFAKDGKLHPRFRSLMERLAKKNGWFVPSGTLLDHLRVNKSSDHVLPARKRASLERRWLAEKMRSRRVS